MEEQDALKTRLTELESEHRDLDDVIARITENTPFDNLQVQRLKKRKLLLKDQIEHVRNKTGQLPIVVGHGVGGSVISLVSAPETRACRRT